jgi:hypothetical protein
MLRVTIPLVLGLTASHAPAGPLNPAWVSAQADWTVHVDMEAAARSAVGKYLLSRPDRFHIGIEQAKAELGMDPFKDIKSLTVYGSADDPGDGVVIVACTPAVDALVERLRKDEHYRAEEDGGVRIHVWTEQGRTRFGAVRPGTDEGERVVFLADSREHLLAGLRVAEGGAPSRAASDRPAPSAGSILFVDAREVPRPLRAAQGAGQFIKLVQGVLIDVGESADQLYADLSLTADSTENATSLLQAAQGFLAVGRMMARKTPESRQFAGFCDAMTMTTEGTKFTARWRYDVKGMIEALREHAVMEEPKAHDADAASPTKHPGER